MITARELLAWGDLDQARRRRARRGLGALPSPAVAVLGGLALFAELTRRLAGGGSPAGASAVFVTAATAVDLIVMFGAPFRLFWRTDTSMLARLAIPGEALFRVGMIRCVRAALLASLALAIGALPFAVWADGAFAARHLAIAGVGFLAAALMGPAVALAAGAIVASDKAQAVLESFGGEIRAPSTSWLGILPGFAGAALVLWSTGLAGWAAGGSAPGGHPAIALGAAAGVCVAAGGWALATASRITGAAFREVAALDQQRLAHIDRSTPSAIERGWFSLLGAGARLVAIKDASLSRRRYPSPYFLGALGMLACWILAIARPASVHAWTAAILGGLAVYSVIMARRLVSPPIELPRFARTLAISRADATAAKSGQAILRAVVWIGAGGAPLIALSSERLIAALIIGACALISLAGGLAAVSAGQAD